MISVPSETMTSVIGAAVVGSEEPEIVRMFAFNRRTVCSYARVHASNGKKLAHERAKVDLVIALLLYLGTQAINSCVESDLNSFSINEAARSCSRGNPLWLPLVGLDAASQSSVHLLETHRYEINDSVSIVKNDLGKPILYLGHSKGPSVSFAHCPGMTWAALCEAGYSVGIDVAYAKEFRGRYPFHRAFHYQELEHCRAHTNEKVDEAAALLWSAKEAAVKALGCGFHLVDPLEARVDPWVTDGSEFVSQVRLVGRSKQRFSFDGETRIPVRSFNYRGVWVSVAVVAEEYICGHTLA